MQTQPGCIVLMCHGFTIACIHTSYKLKRYIGICFIENNTRSTLYCAPLMLNAVSTARTKYNLRKNSGKEIRLRPALEFLTNINVQYYINIYSVLYVLAHTLHIVYTVSLERLIYFLRCAARFSFKLRGGSLWYTKINAPRAA